MNGATFQKMQVAQFTANRLKGENGIKTSLKILEERALIYAYANNTITKEQMINGLNKLYQKIKQMKQRKEK